VLPKGLHTSRVSYWLQHNTWETLNMFWKSLVKWKRCQSCKRKECLNFGPNIQFLPDSLSHTASNVESVNTAGRIHSVYLPETWTALTVWPKNDACFLYVVNLFSNPPHDPVASAVYPVNIESAIFDNKWWSNGLSCLPLQLHRIKIREDEQVTTGFTNMVQCL